MSLIERLKLESELKSTVQTDRSEVLIFVPKHIKAASLVK